LVSNLVIHVLIQCYYFSLCQCADEFHITGAWKKRNYSKKLLVLLYIPHVLPLACKSDAIVGFIYYPEDRSRRWYGPQNFHATFTLDGWNDHIIQPARDAVLDYYKVRTRTLCSACAYTYTFKHYLFSESALRRAIRRRGVHARQ